MIDIMKYIDDEIAKISKELEKMKEKFPNRNIETFYDIGLDGDGCPIDYGNYNDTYDCGYDNGEKSGRLTTLCEIKKVLLSSQA